MNRLLIGVVFGVFMNAAGIVSAYALEFEQRGNVVFVTGNDINFIDADRFEQAFAKGADTVVLSKIGGGRVDVLSGIGRLIKKANVTTVVTDSCGSSCAYLFMAGKQRRYGTLPGKSEQSPVFLSLAGARIEGSNTAANATETYGYFQSVFSDGMPHDLLNKYTTVGKIGQFMVFTRPMKYSIAGDVRECVIREDKRHVDCKLVKGLTPVGVGALTSVEPFDLSDDASTKSSSSVGLTGAESSN